MSDLETQRTVVDADMVRTKASFLIARLAQTAAEPGEQSVALLSLLDDLHGILPSLTRQDFTALRSVIDETLSAYEEGAAWSATAFPDVAISDQDDIEGLNVQCVVVRPQEGGARVEVARLMAEAGGRVEMSTEYSAAQDGAELVVVDGKTQDVVHTQPLPAGFNRIHNFAFELAETALGKPLTVCVVNQTASSDVRWFSTRLRSAPRKQALRPTAVASVAIEGVRKVSPTSIFTPPTAEPLTLSDIDRLMGLKDAFAGERIFVMGNGPSLNDTPLDLLENEFVFGLNRISLLFERVTWRPTFFTAFDVRVVPDNQQEFADLDIPYKFFSARYKDLLGERENHYWHHTKGFYEGFEGAFDPLVPYTGFGGGGTVAVIAVELAFFMGFREIYLIGTDVSYSVKETVAQSGPDQFGDGVGLKLESTLDDDSNHFDPRYFGKGKKWHNPNVREMKIGFARAAQAVERRGGALLNATVGGELDEVPRVSFESLF